jgi:hypothetical protein
MHLASVFAFQASVYALSSFAGQVSGQEERIGAIKKSFFWSLQKIVVAGCTGFSKPRKDTVCLSWIIWLKKAHCGWIKEALRKQRQVRESKWTQSVAVGGKEFVEKVKEQLGFRAKGRGISRKGENYQLREQQSAYNAHFAHKNVPLSDDNAYFWSRYRAI